MNRAAVIFIVVFSAGMYWLVGAPQVVRLEWHRQAEIAAAQPRIEALQARVQAVPGDMKAWAKLGQARMETGRYTESAEAYRHAVLASGGDAGLIVQYNKALIFAANGQVTDEARHGLELALKLQPGNPEARYFLALRELQDGDAPSAMRDMKALYHDLPPGSPLKEIMDRQIGRE